MTAIGESARDPFAVLGLGPDDDLTDDDVRIAWRRIAAATHPDRADGGDPEGFALAASAYTELRTGFGRNEARAALRGGAPDRLDLAARITWAWPARLLLRLAVAAAVAALGAAAAGWGAPAAPALVVGMLTWFLVSTFSRVLRRSPPAWLGRTTTPTMSRRTAQRAGRPARAPAPDAPP